MVLTALSGISLEGRKIQDRRTVEMVACIQMSSSEKERAFDGPLEYDL